MTKMETSKLFQLLASIYPNLPEFKDSNSLIAWYIVLEPVEYTKVRETAIQWSRTHAYPPHVSELAALMIPEQPSPALPHEETAGEAWQRHIDEGKCRDAADELGSVSRYAREHGISWHEAKEALSNVPT